MAAIVLLSSLGVPLVVSVVIGIVGMIAFHGGMMVIPRLRKRKTEMPRTGFKFNVTIIEKNISAAGPTATSAAISSV